MLSKGFIVEATFRKKLDGETGQTDLYIEDLDVGPEHYQNPILDLYVSETGTVISFEYHQVKAIIEALHEIFDRYQSPPFKFKE